MALGAATFFNIARLFLAVAGRHGRVHDHVAETSVSHAVAVRGSDFDGLKIGQDAHHVIAGDGQSGVESTPSARLPQRDSVRHRLAGSDLVGVDKGQRGSATRQNDVAIGKTLTDGALTFVVALRDGNLTSVRCHLQSVFLLVPSSVGGSKQKRKK